ncbi:MAG: hypothetical protein KAT70_04275 [Thermoplasmata archaeon]|nr:hypothetical protein [Thermoplasmata archaeon]
MAPRSRIDGRIVVYRDGQWFYEDNNELVEPADQKRMDPGVQLDDVKQPEPTAEEINQANARIQRLQNEVQKKRAELGLKSGEGVLQDQQEPQMVSVCISCYTPITPIGITTPGQLGVKHICMNRSCYRFGLVTVIMHKRPLQPGDQFSVHCGACSGQGYIKEVGQPARPCDDCSGTGYALPERIEKGPGVPLGVPDPRPAQEGRPDGS